MRNIHLLCGFELHSVALLAVIALTGYCHGEEPKVDERRITIRSGSSLDYPYAEGGGQKTGMSFKARLAEVKEEKDGQLVACMVDTISVPPAFGAIKNGGAGYPGLRKGDLVPIFSYVYRVTGLRKGGEAFKYGHMVDLEWVPNDKLPKGLALGDHPTAAPLMGKIGINEHVIMPLKINPPSRKKDGEPALDKSSAQLWIYGPAPGKPRGTSIDCRAVVRAGDVLLLGDLGFKVRNIVPKDAKTKAIGWVEFTLDPIKKADLDREKVPYVVPKPVKGPPPWKEK